MSKGCDPLLSVEAANPFTRVHSPEARGDCNIYVLIKIMPESGCAMANRSEQSQSRQSSCPVKAITAFCNMVGRGIKDFTGCKCRYDKQAIDFHSGPFPVATAIPMGRSTTSATTVTGGHRVRTQVRTHGTAT